MLWAWTKLVEAAGEPTPVTTELTVPSRVAYRGQEITGPCLRGLLALLAGDPAGAARPPGWWKGSG